MRRIEESAYLSRLRENTLETSILCIGLVICSLVIPSPIAGISVFFTALLVAIYAAVPPQDYLRLLFMASSFVAISLLPLSVTFKGEAFRLTWDSRGFQMGILAGTRAIGTLSATLLFAFTTPFPRIIALLRCVRAPRILRDLFALVYREIFLVDETFSILRKAIASRSGWTNARTGFHAFGLGMAALFVHTLAHSRRLDAGLASRGAENGDVLLWEENIAFRPYKLAIAIAVPIALAVLIDFERMFLGN